MVYTEVIIIILTIHQPNLFPRLKVLQKIALADVWVVLDNVQYCQREYQNRTYIVPEKGGKDFWCTLPIHLINGRSTKINEVTFACKKPHTIIENVFNYHFNTNDTLLDYNDHIISEIIKHDDNFVDFVVSTCSVLLGVAGFYPKIIYASDLNCKESNRSARLVSICKELGADTYIADSGGAGYIDKSLFTSAGVQLLWHIWEPPNNVLHNTLSPIVMRNGSSLNCLERSLEVFIDTVSQCKVTKNSHYTEGK